MRRNSHANSKLTARGHMLRARYIRLRAYYNEHKKLPGKDAPYFDEDDSEAFGLRSKVTVPEKSLINGYPQTEEVTA